MLSKLNVNIALCFQKQQWNKQYEQIALPSVSLLCPAVSEQQANQSITPYAVCTSSQESYTGILSVNMSHHSQILDPLTQLAYPQYNDPKTKEGNEGGLLSIIHWTGVQYVYKTCWGKAFQMKKHFFCQTHLLKTVMLLVTDH